MPMLPPKAKMPTGLPSVKNARYIEDVMHFTLSNVDISIANGLRRTILRDVPTLGRRAAVHGRP